MQSLLRSLFSSIYEGYEEAASNLKWRLESKDLPSLQRLGRGLSGFVYETIWKGKQYARKDFPLGLETYKLVFKNETKFLFNLKHPNIVKCFGYTIGKSSCSLLQEYVDDNLQNTIQKKFEGHIISRRPTMFLSEGNEMEQSWFNKEVHEVVDIVTQIASGMEYLHKHQVIHGDLKPNNVLICLAPKRMDSDDKLVVKVADYGLIGTKTRIELQSNRTRLFDIFMWKAPELFPKVSRKDLENLFIDFDVDSNQDEEKRSYDEFLKSKLAMADVYSFGLICAYIFSGNLNFPKLSLIELQQLKSRDFKPILPSTCPRYLKSLIYKCLKFEANSRPTFSYICTTLRDSFIHGKQRLCNVICEKINLQLENKSNGICILGLYGVGGIGKTTICKALCEKLSLKFHGRVHHAELERISETELLQDILKKQLVDNKSQEHLNKLNLNELYNGIMEREFIIAPIFLALDNMLNTDTSIKQVKAYLSAKLPSGSILLVTTRSKESLMHLRPYIDENAFMEMPSLEMKEAKSLFVHSFGGRNEDEQLIHRCIERCLLKFNDQNYYHPLALQVLGRELVQFDDPKEWEAQLDMIDEDISNQSNENHSHPIFSILRRSFDTLLPIDQMMFMDVALFLPNQLRGTHNNMLEWLGIMHNIPRVDNIMEMLERLKEKSLLESFGDGSGTSIGIHDLWREFCISKTKCEELIERQWVCEIGRYRTCLSDNCWMNVKQIPFLDFELRKLDFSYFSNITVLKIKVAQSQKNLLANLSMLIHLKSLDISGSVLHSLTILGLPRDLLFLSLRMDQSTFQELNIENIGGLEGLQFLQFYGYGSSNLPNMQSMVSLCKANFQCCSNVVTIPKLSLSSKLRVLNFTQCKQLHSCPGIDELVVLEEFDCQGCERLKELPNLRRLKHLRKLNISECGLITELPGLDELLALEELDAVFCSKLSKLPNISQLLNLTTLDLAGCSSINEVPGFDNLISLHDVVADFRAVANKPNLRQLTNLQRLKIDGWSSTGIQELDNLTLLHTLYIGYCSGVDKLPNFQSLIWLQTLSIHECEFMDVSSLNNLIRLESLEISSCKKLAKLPDLYKFISPKYIAIKDCNLLDCNTVTMP